MIRSLILVTSFLVLAANASASPKNIKHILTAAPRAVGRTAENMVTFKDHELALSQWILMSAVLADAKTSFDLTRRCPTPCENYGAIWGAHPSAARVYGTLGLTGLFYSTAQQVAWEVSYLEPNPAGRSFERSILMFPAVIHALLAVHNTQIQPAPALPSGQNIPPELTASNAITH